jgi:pterin-4a-carbinolamine dehydratase
MAIFYNQDIINCPSWEANTLLATQTIKLPTLYKTYSFTNNCPEPQETNSHAPLCFVKYMYVLTLWTFPTKILTLSHLSHSY